MITSVLDHAQKLFGRGFLLAAFVPSALFVLANVGIWKGPDRLESVANALLTGDLKSSAVAVALVVLGVYLLAYVVYGVRASVHELYQGRLFPPPLCGWLSAWERYVIAKRDRQLAECQASIDDLHWAAAGQFGASFVPPDLRQPFDSKEIDRARTRLARIREAAVSGRQPAIDDYRELLRSTRRMIAAIDPKQGPPKDLQALVEDVRSLHEQHSDGLLGVRKALESILLGEWSEAYLDRFETFPRETRWTRATRLGNLTNVLEFYSFHRYGINLSLLWPRLIHVIDDKMRKRVDDANDYFDFAVVMSFLAYVSGLSFLTHEGLVGFRDQAWHPSRLVPAAIALLLGLAFYRLSLHAARAWSVHVRSAVDLFRLELLDRLHLEMPDTPEAESRIWSDLRVFLTQADQQPTHLRFRDSGDSQH